MGTSKITLNNDGAALLGNAILLGDLFKQASLRARLLDESRTHEVGQDRDGCMALKNALYAAGLLDDRIATAIDLSKDGLGYGAENMARRLGEVIASKADIATLQFGDFRYPEVISKRYGIASALVAPDPVELQVPISQLWPSELMSAVRRLAIDYMKDVAASDLGLSRDEAAFIGLDGLVTRRTMREPPKWHLWNSEAARRTRKETGWLEEMLEKARRHVWRPAERLYGEAPCKCDVSRLGGQIEQLGPNLKDGPIPIFQGLNDLAGRFCSEPVISVQTIERLFPSYGAQLDHKNYDVDADPFNFFCFMSAQVLWHGVKRGWVLCFAEDGLEGGCFSWVPPDVFPRLSEAIRGYPRLTDDDELALPETIGATDCFELDQRAKSALGVERLWFAMTSEVATALEVPDQTQAGTAEKPNSAREFNKGFTVSDAPFLEEGVSLLETGGAKSALNAAQQLVAKYGELTENNWTPGRKEIRSYTKGAAEIRLQKKISKEWKARNR